MNKVRNWIFDLDDTLYQERDYERSAFNFVGAEVERLYGYPSFTSLLFKLRGQGSADPITEAWIQCLLPEAHRLKIIFDMRAHYPIISLSDGARAVLQKLRQQSRPYAIITDGRSITQRTKIAALGCGDAAFVSISEEVGLSKLDRARFASVCAAFPFGEFLYVGDNPAKDFFAPKKLGWKTIMLDHREQGIHSQALPDDPSYHPDHIIRDLTEILSQL